MVTLITIPKGKGQKSREETFTLDLANKVLKKSKNWKLKEGSEYILKDGELKKKPKKED